MKDPTVSLFAKTGPLKGGAFKILSDRFVLGRGEECTIAIPDSAISKTHCEIISTVGGTFIKDLGSKNGTLLGGEKIQPNMYIEARNGNEIKIGNTTFRIFFSQQQTGADVREDQDLDETTSTLAIHKKAQKGERAEPPPPRKREETAVPFDLESDRNLATVFRILNEVGTTKERAPLLEKTMDIIMDVLKPDHGFLILSEGMGGETIMPAVVRTRKNEAGEKRRGLGISRTVLTRVAREKNALLSTSIPEDTRLSASSSLILENIHSVICAPIKSSDEVLGVIYFDTTGARASFSKEDLELLSAAGIQLGIILKNMELTTSHHDLFIGIVRTLVNIIEAKDRYTLGHSERVTTFSLATGREMNLDSGTMDTLHISALLHDIGKVTVPENILNKPGKLTDEEFAEIKKHPAVGAGFVRHIQKFGEIIDGILYHHERYDGRGYPTGASGEKIPLIARIICVADSFDAMTSDRPYRKGLGLEKTMEELQKNRGTQFESRIVDAFHSALKKGGIDIGRARDSTLGNL